MLIEANEQPDEEMAGEDEHFQDEAELNTNLLDTESKPGSVFKTDLILKNNHNLRPVSSTGEKGPIPRFKLESLPEPEKKYEREVKYQELRDILCHANEFDWDEYFPR